MAHNTAHSCTCYFYKQDLLEIVDRRVCDDSSLMLLLYKIRFSKKKVDVCDCCAQRNFTLLSEEFVGKEEKSSHHLCQRYKAFFMRQKSISLFLPPNLPLWQANQTNTVLFKKGLVMGCRSKKNVIIPLCLITFILLHFLKFLRRLSHTATFSESFCSLHNCLIHHILWFLLS